jgi:hypothetical protein
MVACLSGHRQPGLELVGLPSWLLVDGGLILSGLEIATIGTPVGETEQLGNGLGFIDPDLIEHVLVADPVVEGSDDLRWIGLRGCGIVDVVEALDEMA